MRARLAPLVSGLGALAACNGATIVIGGLQEVTSMKALPNPNLDLLFVIDNSPSMLDKQVSLAASFPRMMEVLQRLDGGLPNLHVGVVTSDLGTTSSSQAVPGPAIGQLGHGGCAGAGDDGVLQTGAAVVSGRFLSDLAAPDGSRIRNYEGDLATAFSQLATLGDGGCGFEQHLASMRRAFAQPLNAGFLRDDANLAVVIIADEDDCSMLDTRLMDPAAPELGELQSFRCTRFGVRCDPDDLEPGAKSACAPRAGSPLVEDVRPFVDALVAVKGDPRKVMVGVIAGSPEPFELELRPPPGGGPPQLALAHSCAYHGPAGAQVADPAVRLSAFLEAFPGRAKLTSICSSDLGEPLLDLGATAKKLVGDPCLDAPSLTDASPEPGLQPACQVVDVRDSRPGSPREVPACGPGRAADCFEIVADAARCPTTPEHLRVKLHRSVEASDDMWTHVRCQVRD